ncbi:hypothetical protein FBUS_06152 [Fasciolopsis buskii]|uniref:Uncharacterized protein n=1 Tax=Fasciolopsis buskii TaxID=27845 RepID=A0A8E0S7G9_9TREM|nr:hypothetical protein FBUS_06152 [Fasciolopsis buski]
MLPELFTINLPEFGRSRIPIQILRKTPHKNLSSFMFEPLMDQPIREKLRRLLVVFAGVMFEHGLGNSFFLTGTSLLGSIRHHDFIPWETKIQLSVDVSAQKFVRQLLSNLGPCCQLKQGFYFDRLYTLEIESKDYSSENLEPDSVSSEHPFHIEIGYHANGYFTISRMTPKLEETRVWLVETVFPLYLRPFGSQWLPTPCDARTYLGIEGYDVNSCMPSSYWLENVRVQSAPNASCTPLKGKYAFVDLPNDTSKNLYGCELTGVTSERLVLQENFPYNRVLREICVATR